MKYIAIITCLIFSTAFAQNKESKHKIPSAEIKTIDGTNSNSSTFSNDGKPIIISFWATWCKPCVTELNAIAENYEEWQKETGVKLIAVSIDDSRNISKVAPFVNGKNWNYEVYIDPNGDLKRAMNVNNVPHTFLINGKGEIVWQHSSYVAGDEIKLHENLTKVAAGIEIKE